VVAVDGFTVILMSAGGYKYMDDLLRMDHCRPEVLTRLPTPMEQIFSHPSTEGSGISA